MIDPDELTLKTKVWEIGTYRGKRGTTYRARWVVDGTEFGETFKTTSQANVFRGKLLSAQSRGEGFHRRTGLPVSMLQEERPDENWFDFACRYVDHKWNGSSAKHRHNIAEMLLLATSAMYSSSRGKPDGALLRAAMRNWAFSKTRRESGAAPQEIKDALDWIRNNTRPVSELADGKVAEAVTKAATSRLDGTRAAASSRRRNHGMLSATLRFAVTEGILTANPIKPLEASTRSQLHQVDRRTVVNHRQAKALLEGVRGYGADGPGSASGPRMVAFFATMYYSGLRPSEAITLREDNLVLTPPAHSTGDEGEPAVREEWSWLYLEIATPDALPAFTNDGTSRDKRNQLKQRDPGVVRPVPCPPELTRILREHLAEYGTGDGGLVFTGVKGGALPTITYRRAWRHARSQALTEQEQRSPLAATPYALRHTCVSTWLNAGTSETLVAAWAGHSVAVLKHIYAKCIVGEAERAMRKISAALAEALAEE